MKWINHPRGITNRLNAKKWSVLVFFHLLISEQGILRIFHIRLSAVDQPSEILLMKNQNLGLSVYTLTHLNIDPTLKRSIFKMYLELPLFALSKVEKQNISPWETFVQISLSKETHSTDLDLVFGAPHSQALSVAVSLEQFRLSTKRLDHRSLRSMSDIYWQAIKREFANHPSELGPENRSRISESPDPLTSHSFHRFSFVEHNSDVGLISAQVAREYCNATVVSLERSGRLVDQHVKMLADLNILNNAVCLKADTDSYISQRIYESPELFRFQLIARGLLDSFVDSLDLDSWGKDLGNMLSSALTSFLAVPSAVQVSMAMYLFMEASSDDPVTGCYRSPNELYRSSLLSDYAEPGFLSDLNSVSHHPRVKYRGFETIWLLSYLRVEGGSTEISLTSVYPDSHSSIPILIRCDLTNMTRHVHHHYDYAKDGHSRTYTMHVEMNVSETDQVTSLFQADISSFQPSRVNETVALTQSLPDSPPLQYLLPLGMHPNQHKIVSVRLYRDKDSFFIPYTSIYGITLISLLRLGLDSRQRERFFSSFLRLPLYEDMAPWNIVLMGEVGSSRHGSAHGSLDDCRPWSTLTTIPGTTHLIWISRNHTKSVPPPSLPSCCPHCSQVISVLMNYKRTVEDFRRCGGKAPTVYGLAFISDCVASTSESLCLLSSSALGMHQCAVA
jgi:hypothetical protein